MVSLWPWKGNDNSPASFEKALSALASKISKLQTQQESLRTNNRRYKALWTLYTSFAYLLCFVVAFLVLGWKNMTTIGYTALAGAPVVIYVVRTIISTYYNYRLNNITIRLESEQATRNKTIERLKAATKYDSTQTLLEKYGGTTPKPPSRPKKPSPPKKQKSQHLAQRTGMGPPPTANVPRAQAPSQPSPPQSKGPFNEQSLLVRGSPVLRHERDEPPSPDAEFAPNAFPSAAQFANPRGFDTSDDHWYDRILDLLMGEDEILPRNRIALICGDCRLVNGLAPPGTKSLLGLGRWRCAGCGGWNGVVDEGVKALEHMKEKVGVMDGAEGGKEHTEREVVEIAEKTMDESDSKSERGDGESPDA